MSIHQINTKIQAEIIHHLSRKLRAYYVAPDISVSQVQALSAAYRLALKTITKDIGELASGSLNQLLSEAQAALDDLEI